MKHPMLRVVALVAAGALALVACGDDGGSTTVPTSTSTTAASSGATGGSSGAGSTTVASASPSTSAAVATTTTGAASPTIEVTYKAGKVDGGGRKQVAKGQTVTLRVTADIVDEVHLHGYDKRVDTIVNKPVEIVFKADASGVFEAELEKKGLKLVEIEVK